MKGVPATHTGYTRNVVHKQCKYDTTHVSTDHTTDLPPTLSVCVHSQRTQGVSDVRSADRQAVSTLHVRNCPKSTVTLRDVSVRSALCVNLLH